MTLKFECDPYKYELTATDEDWLWDPFDFEEGVIKEYGNQNVDGTLVLTVIGSPMPGGAKNYSIIRYAGGIRG